MNRALILDALQRSALSVTRSLGEHGIPVITADEPPSALAGSSRYSEKYFSYPSPQTQPEEFISALAEIIQQQKIDIIFPMTELTSGLVIQHKNRLHDVAIPFAKKETVDLIADKSSLMQMADTMGIPFPQTWYVKKASELPVNIDDLSYPIVLKPAKSWIVENGRWIHTTVRFADTPQTAKTILQSYVEFQNHPFMIQACVPGNGQGVFALYDQGKALAFFAHRRIREKPPRGGVSVLSESITPAPALLADAKALLDKANWHGIAMVEFRVDGDKHYLMEINTRFWGSLQLAIDAGVDFPYMLYLLSSGQQPAAIKKYRTGKRLRWLLGDIDHLYLTLKDKHFSSANKLRAVGRFLTPSPFKTRHEVNRLDDLGPFIFEMKRYLKDLIS